ncbi:MAG: hypothetical protein J6S22_04320 [Clostridia bacterium]|nr:hypothetical protein [Clostridia bacterium]
MPIKSGKLKKTLKVSVIAVVCCVALAGLFIGVIGILGKTGVLPESLKPFGESIFGKFVEETDPAADLKTEIAEKSVEQNNVLSEVPVKKEKVNPVRSEYQESLRQLETGNLQKIDELWRDLSVPANETEADLFNKYVEQFGGSRLRNKSAGVDGVPAHGVCQRFAKQNERGVGVALAIALHRVHSARGGRV